MSEWKMTPSRDLIAALRLGGWVQGQSGKWPTLLRLHKTDLISDILRETESRQYLWRIAGDPAATGRHAPRRRSIVIYLGGQ